MAERVLVNFFYAHQLGHAIEALHYGLGHHEAHPEWEIHVALSARTPVELADSCRFVTAAHAIDHPFLEDGSAPLPVDLPRNSWEWVLDDGRRYQQYQLDMFPGMRNYYAATDRELETRGRSVVGSPRAGYLPHTALRLDLPAAARARAAATADAGSIAVLPAGSGQPELYPSPASWTLLLDELSNAFPGRRFLLVGKLAADGRTTTNAAAAVDALTSHPSRPIAAVDLPLTDQLALVERCGVLISPHSGFGMAALAVGTPWLSIAGGRWFEYFFNQVPFRSVIPDTTRYPAYTTFGDLPVVEDPDGPRTPSMSDARIRDDAARIVEAAAELLSGSLGYEQALGDYFEALTKVVDPGAIFSIDGVHTAFV